MNINYEENIDKACGIFWSEKLGHYISDSEVKKWCEDCEEPITQYEIDDKNYFHVILTKDGMCFCDEGCFQSYFWRD
jgi:hypothetical protein